MRRAQRTANLRQLRRIPVRLRIDIEEVVLNGFPASDRHAIGESLSQELERLFSDVKVHLPFRRGMELPSMITGPISLPAQAGPDVVGAEVARVVYGSLNAGAKGKK